MSFDWEQFLQFAANLSQSSIGPQEARERCIAGRAYYAAHWLARKFSEKIQPPFKEKSKKSVHQHVINYFQNHHNSNLLQIGIDLDRLRNIRVSADYKASQVKNWTVKAQEALRFGYNIANSLKSMSSITKQMPLS